LCIIGDIYPAPLNRPPNRHAEIIGSLKCPQFNALKTVVFIVDSGASFTTLLPYDVVNLGINCDELNDAEKPCYTATGEPIYPKILPDVELHLNKNNGVTGAEHIFLLDFIHCIKPPSVQDRRVLLPQQETFTLSLLGMDVLYHFTRWTYDFEECQLRLDY
jgi:predicted aspartyl protease